MSRRTYRRAGLTLTELLVVIAIIVIVTAVLAPLLTDAMAGREVREAARQVNLYLQTARTRAQQQGRAVGVLLRRGPNNDNACFQLAFCEEYPPFTGLDAGTKAIVTSNVNVHRAYLGDINSGLQKLPGVGDGKRFTVPLPLQALRAVRVNDEIRFNNRGSRYRILGVGQDQRGTFVQFLIDGVNTTRHTISNLHPVSFEIYLRPRQTSGTPTELVNGAAVMLDLSGVGAFGPMEHSPTAPHIGMTEFILPGQQGDIPAGAENLEASVAIMFQPNGALGRVYHFVPPYLTQVPPKRPQDKVFLFLGKAAVNSVANLLDATNLWVTIDPDTGSVTTSSNSMTLDPLTHDQAEALSVADQMALKNKAISASRQLAVGGQSVGGQ